MIDLFDLNNDLSSLKHDEDSKGQKDKPKENKPILVGIDKDIELKKFTLERLTNKIDMIKVSEKLRAKINKSIKNQVDHKEILIDCIECIYLMSGDKTFYNQNMKYLKDKA